MGISHAPPLHTARMSMFVGTCLYMLLSIPAFLSLGHGPRTACCLHCPLAATPSPHGTAVCWDPHVQDLEHMISHAGLPANSEYAVITGVQIHNWSADVNNDTTTPSWEFVAPST
jgi:hypothetical protein